MALPLQASLYLHLISPTLSTRPPTITLSFTRSFRLSSQPKPFPTLANSLTTALLQETSLLRSLNNCVVLVRRPLRRVCLVFMLTTCRSLHSFPPLLCASQHLFSLDSLPLNNLVWPAMTTADRTTRRVYSAEQLHKLRASCSAPKLREAIEEHDSEDAELVKGTSLPLPPPPASTPLHRCLRWSAVKHQPSRNNAPSHLFLTPSHCYNIMTPYYHYATCRNSHASQALISTKHGYWLS